MITRFHAFAVAIALLLSLSACGQKGPLTHPPRKPATQAPAPQAPATDDGGEFEGEEQAR